MVAGGHHGVFANIGHTNSTSNDVLHAPGKSATVTLTVAAATTSSYDPAGAGGLSGGTLVLTGSDGAPETFTFDGDQGTGVYPAATTKDKIAIAGSADGTVIPTTSDIATQIARSIHFARVAGEVFVTASAVANVVTITNLNRGTPGNNATKVNNVTGSVIDGNGSQPVDRGLIEGTPNQFAGGADWSGSIQFPSVPLRGGGTWGTPKSNKSTFWGAWTGRTATDTFYSPEIPDCLRIRSFDASNNSNPASTDHDVAFETSALSGSDPIVISWVFSLDNVAGTAGTGYSYHRSNRQNGLSITAQGGNNYKSPLSGNINRFTTLLHGGSDGYNITEREPFRNSAITGTDEDADYALFSLKKAINIASDADYVQMNAITIPGVTNATVTDYLLDMVEDRADALALIDIPFAYTPDTEDTGSSEARNAANTPQAAADNLASRSINNSYGAAYYPWVQIQDTNTNQVLWAPPSVAALGVLSSTDRNQAPWFAPAGFTRGGLSEGAAGIPVLDVSRRLSSDERDTLYEDNINPIAKFPAEGIVIFGQKTLQQTASALDRINVRRLMIFLKREISFIASRLLFGPNSRVTWDAFLGEATPLLDGVKAQFGIDDFRLILDENTTTPDLIDRNIIYAKLLVKPTRSVEYFAIDFVVTNSGASFDD